MPFPKLTPSLERALAAQGYREPTAVQAAVLEAEAFGRDLLVSAQTGSGKTVAFGLAFAPDLLGSEERLGQAGAPMALIVAPTRELAVQVSRELTWLYAQTGARVVSCVGGMDARSEQRALGIGAHIVVGTPGRLRDHIERGNLDLSALKVAVLDEADEMLDMGFREDLEEILDATPAERRTLMFSATIAKDIANLARKYQREAVRIDTARTNEPHGDIEYRAIRVAPNEIEHAVVNVLRHFEAPGALVFCGTRDAVRHLHGSLRERGFGVVALSGELTQKERTDALQALRGGHARVCVATDVAARGLDLPDLGLVIHADLPVNRAGLLHRSGRTGRAGKKGVSVVLVPYTRKRRAEQLFANAGVDAAWSGPPGAEEIRAADQKRLLDDPMLTEPPTEEDAGLIRAVLAERSPEQVAAALIRLHRSRLPAPEELYDAGPDHQPSAGRDRPERELRHDRIDSSTAAWFRLTVGRSKQADPKWLIPLICRLGHITKKDIGAIRIFDRETKFEISEDAKVRFAEAVKGQSQGDIRIEPSASPGERPPFRDKPAPGLKAPYSATPRPAYKPHAGPKPAYRPRTEGAPASPDRPAAGPKPPFKGKPHPRGAASGAKRPPKDNARPVKKPKFKR